MGFWPNSYQDIQPVPDQPFYVRKYLDTGLCVWFGTLTNTTEADLPANTAVGNGLPVGFRPDGALRVSITRTSDSAFTLIVSSRFNLVLGNVLAVGAVINMSGVTYLARN